MVELFRKAKPAQELAWTGERFVTGVEGLIAIEHLHRYFLARDVCRGKDVLDVASGEGYGTALLAQVAASATGVEIAHDVVAFAALNYQADNLSYLQGAATALPVGDQSVDAVVSFETLEHFVDHDGFFAEVRRVLRPGGFLLISTPDPDVYSAFGTVPNPYHVRELTELEFVKRLGANFKHVSLMRQRAFVGSAILSQPGQARVDGTYVFEQRDSSTFESSHVLPRAPYLLAVAADDPPPAIDVSLYIETGDVNAMRAGPELQAGLDDARAEVERLRTVEADLRMNIGASEAVCEALRAKAEGLRQEAEGLRQDAEGLRQEAEGLRQEAEGLRQDAEGLRQDAARLNAALGDARTRIEELERARVEADVASRVQTLSLFRAETELRETQGRLIEAERELRQSRGMLDRLAPIWLRRLVPARVRHYAKSRLLRRP